MKRCVRVAYDKGYEYFAIQFSGECFGGKDARKQYAKHGKSGGCWVFDNQTGHGVGGSLTNFVYRINKVCMKYRTYSYKTKGICLWVRADIIGLSLCILGEVALLTLLIRLRDPLLTFIDVVDSCCEVRFL